MKEEIQPKKEKLDAEKKTNQQALKKKRKCIYNTMILKIMYFHFLQ